ncbi:MAG TPA: MFS transporter [Solirubrobacterales bacterium]|nr:MFS transporter [Solirubrobacterales bacterium]
MNSANPLADSTYRRLFGAQVIALSGTGLATVALTLLAYDLAGGDAGVVVGAALGIKMVVYVFVAPLVVGLLTNVPRRRLLVGFDLLRAASVAAMPFVTEVWQVFALIALVNSGSAGFTPTFQATIPDILPDESRFTRALSLSRLAYELEGLLSPVLAGVLLLVITYNGLFTLNAVAFLCSAALVLTTTLPARRLTDDVETRWRRVTYGLRRYLATPRLRGLLALNLAVASAGAMVIVNTVLYVRDSFGLDSSDVAWALAASGAGAMLTALVLPSILDRIRDRSAMFAGAALLGTGLGLATFVTGFLEMIAIWFVLGVGLSAVQTPAGRLIRRSGEPGEMPGLFAAQFSLSHACWLLAYPLAGLLGATIGLSATAAILAALAFLSLIAAAALWRSD